MLASDSSPMRTVVCSAGVRADRSVVVGLRRRVLPRWFAGDYLTDFGLDRVVEELESVEVYADRHGSPAELIAVVTELHRDALDRFGAVGGELLAVARL